MVRAAEGEDPQCDQSILSSILLSLQALIPKQQDAVAMLLTRAHPRHSQLVWLGILA